jgi:hypothetical protein
LLLCGSASSLQAQTMVEVPPPPRTGAVTVWTVLADRLGSGGPNWRTIALMHLAMHDALNAVEPRFARFAPPVPDEPSAAGALPAVAMAAAAFQVLIARHPDQVALLEPAFRSALEAEGPAKAQAAGAGIRLGAAIGIGVVERLTTSLPQAVPFPKGDAPGRWRPTPPFFQHGWVSDERPLLAASSTELRGPPPPVLGSTRDLADLAEIRRLGGENSAERSAAQTEAAVFWGRQTSQRGFVHLAVALLAEHPPQGGLWAEARAMAQLSAALSDAYVTAWDAKRHYAFWRPATAIAASEGADRGWEPLLPTPPHPDYPSGHSADCTAGAKVLQGVFGPALRDITYVAVDARPPVARRFPNLAAAALECSQSRIWAGAHFRAATKEGQRLGAAVAERALAALPPLPRPQ